MPRINSPAELEEFRKDIISKRDPDTSLALLYVPERVV